MCADYDRYVEMYQRRIGHSGTYALWRVRLARQLMEQHRQTCPVCRVGYERTNYRAGKPMQYGALGFLKGGRR